MASLQGFIDWCVSICQSGNARYSMSLDLRNGVTSGGHRYFDCSSFINIGLVEGGEFSTPGYYPGGSFTTYTMIPVLLKLGFQEVPLTGEWKPGDILWRQTHTEVVYSGGSGQGVTMGAHTSKYVGSRQVSINSYTSSSTYPAGSYKWLKLFRYTGDSTEPTKPTQKVSMYVIAAMCGNFMQESQVNPGVWESLKKASFTALNKGCGLGQWTNTGGDTHGRLYKMADYCQAHGGIYNGDTQCDYIIVENVWQNNDTSYGYESLSDFLSSDSTDIVSLTHAWNINWEGIHDSTWETRVEYARLILDYLPGHADDQLTWISTNNWITQQEQLNNAVLVYQHFNSSASGINPNPVDPAADPRHRVTMIPQGSGTVTYSPELAETGMAISYAASPEEGYTFDRWVVRYPYDLSLSGDSGTFNMPDSDVIVRGYFSDWDEQHGYSESRTLYIIVTGHVDMTATWYTQDGGTVSQHITFDSNENRVYTYLIGITDDIHITVNAGTRITPVTPNVPGWTEDIPNNRYFFFMPDADVTLNVLGTEVKRYPIEKRSRWWMFMRPVWTWKNLWN